MESVFRIPELVHEIIGYLDSKSDLINVRLLHRTFSCAALSSIFNEVRIKASNRSLSRLIDISFTPHLAPLVKSVCLVTSPSISELLWPDFQEILARELQGVEDEQKQMALSESVYSKLLQEWLVFAQSHDYSAMLSTAFTNLPHLEALSICQFYKLLGPDKSVLKYSEKPSAYYHKSSVTRAFEALSSAALFSRRKIKSFRISVEDRSEALHASYSTHSLTTSRRGRAVNSGANIHVPPFFRHCQEIKLALCRAHRPYYALNKGFRCFPSDFEFSNAMSIPLSQAINLKDLEISFDPTDLDVSVVLFTHLLRKDHTWPKLKSFSITGSQMNQNDVTKFVQLHNATLRKLSFRNCILSDGRWGNLMKSIQANSNIESFEVYPMTVSNLIS